eukprot:UN26462
MRTEKKREEDSEQPKAKRKLTREEKEWKSIESREDEFTFALDKYESKKKSKYFDIAASRLRAVTRVYIMIANRIKTKKKTRKIKQVIWH